MIAFKYTKTDCAEFLSHLDLLRHVYRTLRRAQIPVAMSEGYHAHARIFLNNPLPVGVRSVAEYGAIDTPFISDFGERFNSFSPEGVKCLDFISVDKNPSYASSIERCTYVATGLAPFDTEEILSERAIEIVDMRGRRVDIRPRIYAVEWQDGRLTFTLGCGNENLRPDLFCSYLSERFGGRAEDILKTASYGKGVF